MTLLTICQNIAKTSKTDVPTSIIGNNAEIGKQLFSSVRIATKDIAWTFDWEILQKKHSFDSVASTQAYSLPVDYARMIDNTFWNTTQRQKIINLTPTEWRYMQDSTTVAEGLVDYYRIRGGELLLLPTPASIKSFNYEYITTYTIKSSIGADQTEWLADNDYSVLDEFLIELQGTWRFLKMLGKDIKEAQNDYNSYLQQIVSSNSTRRTITPPNLLTGYSLKMPPTVPAP